MRKTTSAEATLPVLTRSCRSLARNASSNPGWLVIVWLGIVWFPDFQEQVHARDVRADCNPIRRRLTWLKQVKLLSCSINQMPIEQVFHSFAPRIGRLNIGEQQQPTRGNPIVHDIRQRSAYEVREIGLPRVGCCCSPMLS